jgi:hypothetical protein
VTNEKKITRIRAIARDVRQIAEGIYDKGERRTLLNFVEDAEGLARNVAKPPSGDSVE